MRHRNQGGPHLWKAGHSLQLQRDVMEALFAGQRIFGLTIVDQTLQKRRLQMRYAVEGLFAGHHFVQHCAKRPDIAARIHVFTRKLLGRHVLKSTDYDAGLRQRFRPSRLGLDTAPQLLLGLTEVQNLSATAGQHDIGGLEIAMHDT